MSMGGRTTREFLDAIFNNGAFASLANVYVSLHTGDPGEDGQGAGEVSGNGYARVSTAPGDWGPAAGADPSALANTSTVTFPPASGGAWGTITHMGFWTHSSTTSEAVFVGGTALAASKSVGDGDTAQFAIGEIDVTAD